MKIYRNTSKWPPLGDAIDDYKETHDSSCALKALALVEAHMSKMLKVKRAGITPKDVRYFIHRMGVVYLHQSIRGITPEHARLLIEHLKPYAHENHH